jgi:predicted dehydrogenase
VLYGIDPMPPADAKDLAADKAFRIVTNLSHALEDPAVEGVVLATPHALHEEQALAVLAAGKELFCEKPLAMTSAGAKRILDACDHAGKVLGIGHERRYEPAFEELQRRLKSGALGKLLLLEANVSHNLFQRLPVSNWRLDPVHAPAGMMTAVGIHLTDLFVQYAGEADEVCARSAALVLDPPAQDFITTNIVFRSGVRASMTCLSATPYHGRFAAFGETGWIEIISTANVDRGKETILVHSDGQDRQHFEYPATDTVRSNFDAWADAVEGLAPYRFSRAQILENIRIFEAIVESSKRGGTSYFLTGLRC